MKLLVRSCCIMVLVLLAGNTIAQNLELVENKGQWPAQVKFKATTTVGAFFLQSDGYRMLLNNREDLQHLSESAHGHSHGAKEGSNTSRSNEAEEKIILRSHAYEMKFAGAAANAVVVPEKVLHTYNNYFIGNDPAKWATHCRIFEAVTYKNMYPGIDVRYYSDAGKLKYDIIVNPGASVESIVMRFDGVDGLEVVNDNLVIKTSVDNVQELKPYTYQAGVTGRKEVSNRYTIRGNEVRFKTGTYDKTKTLVIDPSLIFSTFSGSTIDNWGYTATYDLSGHFYGGGIVFGQGFPVSVGAFQVTYQGGFNDGSGGGYDIGIIKFTPNAEAGTGRVYATYIGGDGNEQPHSLVVDSQNNLVIAGRSNSGNYPQSPGIPLLGAGGGWDIIITKLNSTGTALIGSRRIGGAENDGVNIRPKSTSGAISINRNYGDDARSEVIVDGADNVYVASCTRSPAFPVTTGVFQPSFGGTQDGVLLKLSPGLDNVLFSSFIGGSGDDAAFVLALNPFDNRIYVAGATTSNDFPGMNSGAAVSNSFLGVADGFVSIVSNDGTAIEKSTYLGTSAIDIVYGIQFDKKGFPYVMGTTTGQWPVLNAAFVQQNGKQFIAKLQPDLSAYIYSTTFGTNTANPNISPVAFLVDRCENVYVSGWGGELVGGWPSAGTAGLSVTSNALQLITDGKDFYFFVLQKNASSQLYGSFFGARNGNTGDHVDGGTSRFDQNGIIYQAMCGFCGGGPNAFPTHPAGNVWAANNGSTRCNLAAIKIEMDFSGVANGIKSFINGTPRNVGCIPLTVDFRDTLAQGVQYIWNFGDNSPEVTTTTATVSHTYPNIGSYQIRLISIDSTTCNIADTSYATIHVREDKAFPKFTYMKLPPCENLRYRFTNTSIPPPPPGKPFGNQSFRWNFGDGSSTVIAGTQAVEHTYPAIGTYIVRLELIDTNYCNSPDVYVDTIRISDNVKAKFTTPPFGCVPYTAPFHNTSEGGSDFTWYFGDGNISNLSNPTHTYTTPGTYIIKLVAADSNTCNKVDSAFYTITVSAVPTAIFDYSPNPPQVNTAVSFTNFSTGATSYLWKFGDGDSLRTLKKDTTIRHFYNSTGNYQVCLIAYNDFGCPDTMCKTIAARAIPALDVPNAFTPNGDGVNDKIFVRGFAIAKMNWRIYNRWGQVVFATTHWQEGWDGKFKGAIQAQDVYTYTLDIEFTDGTRATKTGDITLLR